MSVTEFPKFGQPRIPNGTFVIFSFDPVSYAADLDEKAADVAAQITRTKYLGLIEGVGTLDLPKMRLNLDIRVAGHVPPQEGEDDVYRTSPARCIPIFPATTHSDDRVPLKPSNPLPWPDGCYLHTLQLINAFVSRVHHANPTNATISKEEIARVGHLVAVDEHEASRNRAESEDGSEDAGSESCYPSDEGDEETSETSSVEQPFVKPIKVYIEIWEDLGVADTLGEPKNVGRDIDEIVAIGEDWEKRMNYEYRAKAPQTSQWAAGVAESGHEDPNAILSDPPVPNVSYDDELAPEDAVDERILGRAREADIVRNATPDAAAIKSNSPEPLLGDAHSAVSSASREASEGGDSSVAKKGALRFVTARAVVLRSWLRNALHL